MDCIRDGAIMSVFSLIFTKSEAKDNSNIIYYRCSFIIKKKFRRESLNGQITADPDLKYSCCFSIVKIFCHSKNFFSNDFWVIPQHWVCFGHESSCHLTLCHFRLSKYYQKIDFLSAYRENYWFIQTKSSEIVEENVAKHSKN